MTHDCFGELSSNSPRRVVQYNFIRKLVLCFQEQKPFVLKTVFLILGLGMREGVGDDSSHEIGHVDIRVGIMNSLECVCLPLQKNTGLCLPRHEIPHFQVFRQTALTRGRF